MSGVVWADRERDVVLVEGPDAGTFLHSQLAADVVAVPVGGSAHSLLLDPTGHVVALVRVVHHTDDTWTLDVEKGHGAAVVERLRRFVLRSRLTMNLAPWSVRAFRGAGARHVLASTAHPGATPADPAWGSPEEVDLVGPAEAMVVPEDATPTEPGHIEMLRVDARWPALGVDLVVGDVPATCGVVHAVVSFTKGCYPGQELVERMDSRGASAPVELRVLPRQGLGVGSRVQVEGRDVGTVTSVGTRLAIARVARGAHVGEPVTPTDD